MEFAFAPSARVVCLLNSEQHPSIPVSMRLLPILLTFSQYDHSILETLSPARPNPLPAIPHEYRDCGQTLKYPCETRLQVGTLHGARPRAVASHIAARESEPPQARVAGVPCSE